MLGYCRSYWANQLENLIQMVWFRASPDTNHVQPEPLKEVHFRKRGLSIISKIRNELQEGRPDIRKQHEGFFFHNRVLLGMTDCSSFCTQPKEKYLASQHHPLVKKQKQTLVRCFERTVQREQTEFCIRKATKAKWVGVQRCLIF